MGVYRFRQGIEGFNCEQGWAGPYIKPKQINANNKIAGFFAADNYAFAGAVAA